MKKLAFIVGIVLIAAALVTAGWYVGYAQRVFFTEAYAIPTTDKHLTDVAITAMILNQIDSGRLDDARHYLQLRLEGEILSVDSLLDSSDARTHELARKVFVKIGQYRSEHPSSYTGEMAHPDADVMAKIDSILKRSSEEPKK
jgi:hypothetical protein